MSHLAIFGNSFRRLYNSLEHRIDKRILNQEVRSVHQLGGGRSPITACAALSKIWPTVKQMDESVHLKSVSSPVGVNAQGKSSRWNFTFELHHRRARLQCAWLLPWDQHSKTFESAVLDISAVPYPPKNSTYRQMVMQGKMLCRELTVLWHQERRKRPDLPLHFRDTDIAIRELMQQGLNIGSNRFVLTSNRSSNGKMNWLAQMDEYMFYTDFLKPGQLEA